MQTYYFINPEQQTKLLNQAKEILNHEIQLQTKDYPKPYTYQDLLKPTGNTSPDAEDRIQLPSQNTQENLTHFENQLLEALTKPGIFTIYIQLEDALTFASEVTQDPPYYILEQINEYHTTLYGINNTYFIITLD